MADFHFIRPLWLLATFVLFFAVYLLKKYRLSQSGWQQLLPNHLSKILLDEKQEHKSLSFSITIITPFIIGLLTIIALAGPTWKKLPQPVFQLTRGSVLIMDMSYSMLATDLSPNRVTRARYKATDLLDNLNEGEMGLIAYAGDAFIISPLTEDINNIKLLLPSLSPDIMPELGSNPLAALTLANEMLLNSGHAQGDIYWFTDGIDQDDQQDITQWSRSTPHRLNILGIGTKTGAPIKLTNGELMKDDTGAIVIPKLAESLLYGSAKRGRGTYQSITNDNNDIESLLNQTLANENLAEESKNEMGEDNPNIGDQWQETGPYLLLLVLPLILIYFRRGNLIALLPLALLLFPNEQAFANTWQDLWKTKDQQAQKKYNNKAYNEAAQQFTDPLWQGSAHYKAGNFEEALAAFEQHDTPQALYNKGNTLAKLNKLEEAIEAYDNALAKNPELADAKANKALIEQLKQQQDQQEKQDKEQKDKKDQDQEQQDKSEQDQKNKEQQDQQKSDQDSSEDKNQEQQDSDSKEQKSEQQKEQEQQKKDEEAKKQQEEAEKKNDKENTKEDDKKPEEAQSQQAKLAEEKLAQEKEQKHQQLLNKVTDDPYLLLRNKMQLEYQKRKQNKSSIGAKKKW